MLTHFSYMSIKAFYQTVHCLAAMAKSLKQVLSNKLWMLGKNLSKHNSKKQADAIQIFPNHSTTQGTLVPNSSWRRSNKISTFHQKSTFHPLKFSYHSSFILPKICIPHVWVQKRTMPSIKMPIHMHWNSLFGHMSCRMKVAPICNFTLLVIDTFSIKSKLDTMEKQFQDNKNQERLL